MRHLPQMNEHVEDDLMRGARVDMNFNQNYPEGVVVYYIDTNKAKYMGHDICSAWSKRKVENLFIMNNPKQKLKVCFT